MPSRSFLPLFLFLLSPVSWLLDSNGADIAPLLKWTVETARPAAQDWPMRRGETVIFQPTFQNYGFALDLTEATNVLLRYKTAAMTNTYYAATGSVYLATGGVCRVRWTSAQEPTNPSVQYDLSVLSSSSVLCRTWGKLTFASSVADAGATSTVPEARYSLDWAVIDNSNIGSAPFLAVGSITNADTSGTNAIATNAATAYQWAHPTNAFLRSGAVTNVDASGTNDIATNAATAYQWAHPTNGYLRAGAVTNVDAAGTNAIATNAATAYQWAHPTNGYLKSGAITNPPATVTNDLVWCFDTPTNKIYWLAALANSNTLTSVDAFTTGGTCLWSVVTSVTPGSSATTNRRDLTATQVLSTNSLTVGLPVGVWLGVAPTNVGGVVNAHVHFRATQP
jgi:hypothetical protein